MSTRTTHLNIVKPASGENVNLSVINGNYDIIDAGVAAKVSEPETEGTTGQVLTTDGNGGRTWQDAAGGAEIDDTTTAADTVWSSEKTSDELETVSNAKVNISDIINNLTSTATNKPLAAAQGKALSDTIATHFKNETISNSYTGTEGGAKSVIDYLKTRIDNFSPVHFDIVVTATGYYSGIFAKAGNYASGFITRFGGESWNFSVDSSNNVTLNKLATGNESHTSGGTLIESSYYKTDDGSFLTVAKFARTVWVNCVVYVKTPYTSHPGYIITSGLPKPQATTNIFYSSCGNGFSPASLTPLRLVLDIDGNLYARHGVAGYPYDVNFCYITKED